MSLPEIEARYDARRFSDLLSAQEEMDRQAMAREALVNHVCGAIRKCTRITDKQVQAILHTLSNKMAESGFPETDVDSVADVADLIGG